MTDGVEAFKLSLLAAFPPRPFHGLVSTHDERGEGTDLRAELSGKRWDEVPVAFIDFNSASLSLMEPEALVFFLPAWLLRSMERLGDESMLSKFTLYFLCPGNEQEGWDEDCIAAMADLFNSDQRDVVGTYLRAVLQVDEPRYWHSYAKHGLRWWRR
jgi:hypothetical protein